MIDAHSGAIKSAPMPATYIRLLLAHFGKTPELRTRLCAGTGFDERQLDADAELTVLSYLIFKENLTKVAGEDWPLTCLHSFASPAHGALGAAVCSAKTVGHGLQIVEHFAHVRAPYVVMRVKPNGNRVRLTLEFTVAHSLPCLRANAASTIFCLAAVLYPMLGKAAYELEFHFPWPSPPYGDAMAKLLKRDIHFNQPELALTLPVGHLDIRSPYADAGLLRTSVEVLEASARRLRGEETVVSKLHDLFSHGEQRRITEDQAARELGMSRRTLVRRLADQNTSYRALLDSHLKQRAAALLAFGHLSRGDIAEQLGFADAASFSRACRRWFRS